MSNVFRIDSVLRQEVERARQVTEVAKRSLILAGALVN
jgi:hypothetical protein